MLEPPDPRERAFNVLVPMAPIVHNVLAQADSNVAADVSRNESARATWTLTQRRTSAGYGRFCWVVDGLKLNLVVTGGASYISTPSQEASNLFLWRVGPSLTLRVKSEPSELVAERTEPMFARESSSADETVCLSWDVTLQQTIRDPRFVSVHDRDPWSISLMELLAAPANVQGIGSRRALELVKSKRVAPAPTADDVSPD